MRIAAAGDSAVVAGSRLVEAIADRMVAGSASPGWMLMEAIPESSAAVSASEGGLCWEGSMSWVFNVDWWRWVVSGQREEAGLMNTRAWPRKSARNLVTIESSTKQRRPAVTYPNDPKQLPKTTRR